MSRESDIAAMDADRPLQTHERLQLELDKVRAELNATTQNMIILQAELHRLSQWRAVAEQMAAALTNCMGHVPGEHIHWKVGFKTIGAYEKLKGTQ